MRMMAGRGRRSPGRKAATKIHGWAAIRVTAKERGGSSNGGGACVAGCLGGDRGDVEGDGDYVEKDYHR